MKKFVMTLFACFVVNLLFISASEGKMKDINAPDLNGKTQDIRTIGTVKPDLDFGKFPLYFIYNKGQVNEKANFYAKASRYTLWMTKEGLVFDSIKKIGVKKEPGNPHLPFNTHGSSFERDVSRLFFINANKNPEIVPVEETKYRVNYFIGNDRSKWHCDITASQGVLYKNLYKNIDLKVHGLEKQIEYDWIVKPGGNPGDIIFEYKDIKGTRIDDEGNLIVETDFGELLHKCPFSYQEIDKKKIVVKSGFKKISKNIYGFELNEYDRNYELIIDPVVLAYSTYLGGNEYEQGLGIAVDSSGDVYVTGYTYSTNFPTKNQYQTDPGDSACDVFVTKIDTTKTGASSLIYSTYFGGNSNDYGHGIAVDSSGNAYVAGYTYSTNFPTKNQYQSEPGDSAHDAFITKIDTTKTGASSFIYSTYLGGNGDDIASGIAVDSSGNAYAAGYTHSTDFPTKNQYQGEPGDSNGDAFLTKIDTTKTGSSSLIYSTYLGGDGDDRGWGTAVDSSGKTYVTGYTDSTDFPVKNHYQADEAVRDAFVTKIDTTTTGNSSLVYSTYLGGNAVDTGYEIAADSSGNVYVTGETSSTDFPTKNQYQSYYRLHGDVFVTKIDTTTTGNSSLVYSTYLGGNDVEAGFGIAADSSGNAYVTGYTRSTDFPTSNHYQSYQSNDDAFVTKIDTTKTGFSSLIYSTYLGGNIYDYGKDIAVDSSGNAYVTGETYSTDFPTKNQYQSDETGADTFAAKIVSGLSITITSPTSGTNWAGGTTQDITWTSTQPFDSIDIEYTTNYISEEDSTWVVLVNGAPDTGSYSWVIPNVNTDTARIWMKGWGPNGDRVAWSELFSITEQLSITITSPTSGTNWTGGTTQDITWTSTQPFDSIDIEYTTNYISEEDSTWVVLVNGAPDTGSYSWVVPNVSTDTALIWMKGWGTNGDRVAWSELFSITDSTSPSITVTSPNGGESWGVVSNHNITWTSSGPVGNIKIQYSTNNGSSWSTITSSTSNDGSYSWTIPNNPSNQCKVKVMETDGSPFDTSDSVFSIVPATPPEISLNRTQLNFGSTISGITTTSQTLNINNSGGGTLNWTLNDNADWLNCSPTSGTNSGTVTVSVDPTGLSAGTYTGTITVSDSNASNTPQTAAVTLIVYVYGTISGPFGVFATPIDGSTVRSSIAVTGWALDNIGVESVKIYRGQVGNLVYIGDAVFVEGARPDVEQAYPGYPMNYKAGWGYMMLTNFFPGGGNGTFKIHAIVTDAEGHQVTLGTKTILCDNANAVKPFGAIDTPVQGGMASGNKFINWGWVLTPLPNWVPTDGSTIHVFVDGVNLGHPTYNIYRTDIANLFTGYANSDGAAGYFYLDTTPYENGVHTIQWTAADNAGNTDGIGSRYFTIQNTGGARVKSQTINRKKVNNNQKYCPISQISNLPVDHSIPISVKRNLGDYRQGRALEMDGYGVYNIGIKELEPIVAAFSKDKTLIAGYTVVGEELRPLPIGSTLDWEAGKFYWQPGPGFLGEYRFVFIQENRDKKMSKRYFIIRVEPKFTN